ncbi:MAG: hypothetical protein WC716_02325 [Chitinophagaceae bacterium]
MAEAADAPAETNDAPAEVSGAPTEAIDAQAEAANAPTEAIDAPAEAKDALAEANYACFVDAVFPQDVIFYPKNESIVTFCYLTVCSFDVVSCRDPCGMT